METLSDHNGGPGAASRLEVAFVDRDGTVNVKAPDGAYITSPRELRLLPGAGAALRRLNDAGVRVVVVTNQRGVALGRMTLSDVDEVNAELQRRLRRWGARVDAFMVCPHDIGTCDCRKPGPGLLVQALDGLPGVRPRLCVMIGDSETDVEAGHAAGCRAVRLGSPGTPTAAEELHPDIVSAVGHLLGRPSRRAS